MNRNVIIDLATVGLEYTARFPDYVFHLKGAPSSNRGKPHDADGAHSLASTSSGGIAASEGNNGLQPSRFAVHETAK